MLSPLAKSFETIKTGSLISLYLDSSFVVPLKLTSGAENVKVPKWGTTIAFPWRREEEIMSPEELNAGDYLVESRDCTVLLDL